MEPNKSDKPVKNLEEIHDTPFNSTILNYYKVSGRERGIEQYFAFSTADSSVRDSAGTYWSKMKTQPDSSNSSEKGESSTEVCRISIRCSAPDNSQSSQDDCITAEDRESPPIISDDLKVASVNSEHESEKSDFNTSHKSHEPDLDSSANKINSPTSSFTFQRKLEWDSMADVGYANEGDRKHSGASLSTLERLALKQQYSNNDKTRLETLAGSPAAQSTPVEDNKDTKDKPTSSKGHSSKSSKLYKKDVDVVKVNVPPMDNVQAVNVNLTKHISFNVDNQSGIISEITNNPSEKVTIDTAVSPEAKIDKEIQTTLNKKNTSTDKSQQSNINFLQTSRQQPEELPMFINLNSLKRCLRNNKRRSLRTRRSRRNVVSRRKLNLSSQEKSGEQVSEAESFEYMPGHIYNQKQHNSRKHNSTAGNKSSLESSGATTGSRSSKNSTKSLTKDLEAGYAMLNEVIQQYCHNSKLKKKVTEEIVLKLLNSKYKNSDIANNILSELTSNNSNHLKLEDFKNYTTTSTSDANNSSNALKSDRPKKSILRKHKFDSLAMPSTTQSVPNIPIASTSDSKFYDKQKPIVNNTFSTESEESSKYLHSSESAATSSEDLYKKYLEALKKEQRYKKYLLDKGKFMKQKLVGSELTGQPNLPPNLNINKVNDLMHDLTRNNYNDGSGDASKLEGGSISLSQEINKSDIARHQRSHSVFTLSSGNSDRGFNGDDLNKSKQLNIGHKLHDEVGHESNTVQGTSKNLGLHYCCCPFHKTKVGYTDSAVQVDVNVTNANDIIYQELSGSDLLKRHNFAGELITQNLTGELKYVCLCTENCGSHVPNNFLIYKCARLNDNATQFDPTAKGGMANDDSSTKNLVEVFSSEIKVNRTDIKPSSDISMLPNDNICCKQKRLSQCSQTQLNIPLKSVSKQAIKGSVSSLKLSDESVKLKSNVSDCSNRDCPKCIQTDISINPKISDPTLSDVNIINQPKSCLEDNDCRKCNTKKSEEDDSENITNLNLNLNEVTSQESVPSAHVITQAYLTETKVNNNTVQPCMGEDLIFDINYSVNKYTIPLEGTNMALSVDIDDHIYPCKCKDKVESTTQGVITDKVISCEKATSLQNECSKAVQSNIMRMHSSSSDTNINKLNRDMERFKNSNIQSFNVSANKEGFTGLAKTYPPRGTAIVAAENQCTSQSNQTKECVVSEGKKNVSKNDVLQTLQKSIIGNVGKTNCPEKCNTFPSQASPKKRLVRHNTCSDVIPSSSYNVQAVTIENDSRHNQKDIDCSSNYSQQNKKEETCESDSKNSSRKKVSDQKENVSEKKTKSIKDSVNSGSSSDAIVELIKDITNRYSKHDFEKNKKKKCFKEIMSMLTYLVDTDDSTEFEQVNIKDSTTTLDDNKSRDNNIKKSNKKSLCNISEKKKFINKAVQPDRKIFQHGDESSDIPCSSDLPGTSSDSAACKILNKIKNECERYYQKRKTHSKDKKCEVSSSTSVTCERCVKLNHCCCKVTHKCKNHRSSKSASEKVKKKCVAYNLIIQTSDSIVSEETALDKNQHPLRDIIVKVPSKRRNGEKNKTDSKKVETNRVYTVTSPYVPVTKSHRSRSLPNDSDVSSIDDVLRKSENITVRDYLEKNRPDFLERCAKRQRWMKTISEARTDNEDELPRLKMMVVHPPNCYCAGSCNMYCQGYVPTNWSPSNDPCCPNDPNEVTRVGETNERIVHRQLLSLQLEREPDVNTVSLTDLRKMAQDLGFDYKKSNDGPKLMSEKKMKMHSEKIYKTLPEIVQKKEELKKERIKKTNLIMASLFKKNLQKRALKGTVNLSNYSAVIKI